MKTKNKKPPTNPEGGWLPPNKDDFFKFIEEIQEEARLRFGVDEDGDPCVVVKAIDRSRFEYNSYASIPRNIEHSPYHPYGERKWSKARHTPEEEEVRRIALLQNKKDRLRMIEINQSVAKEELRHFFLDMEFELRDEIDAPEQERQERIKELTFQKKKWENIVEYLLRLGYTVDQENGICWYKDEDEEQPIPNRPANYDDLMKELDRLIAYKAPKPIDF